MGREEDEDGPLIAGLIYSNSQGICEIYFPDSPIALGRPSFLPIISNVDDILVMPTTESHENRRMNRAHVTDLVPRFIPPV